MLTLVDALDAIDISAVPEIVNPQKPINIGPVSIQIVSFWYRTHINKPETGKYKVKVIGPNGTPGPSADEIEINLISNSAINSVIELPAIPYVGLGLYYFEVEKKGEGESSWSTTARLPLQIRQQQTQG
jgi:hypothetical protein